MSNYRSYGSLTANGQTTSVTVCRYVTLSAVTTGGTPGTLAWQFKGPDGVWRAILSGTSAVSGGADFMQTVYFGDTVAVRGNLTGATGATWSWQIMSNSGNRD